MTITRPWASGATDQGAAFSRGLKNTAALAHFGGLGYIQSMKKHRCSVFLKALFVLLLLPFLASAAAAAEGTGAPADARQEKERQPILAGGWYPAAPNDLRESVLQYLADTGNEVIAGKLVGLIAPHAGYVYSGAIAGKAYAVLEQQQADTVVVVAPSHQHFFRGFSVYDQGGYRTPLGVMELDREFIGLLHERLPELRYVPEAHAKEHSLEIQIPFLQVAAPKARLVPLIMGHQGLNVAMALGEALASVVQASNGKRVVLVASSDLSHFHHKTECQQLDARIHQAIRSMDPHSIATCMASRACEACGAGPMIAVLFASELLGADESHILAVGDSSDTTGDSEKVVGYMSAVFLKSDKATRKDAPRHEGAATTSAAPDVGKDPETYGPEDRELLHRVAREAIEKQLHGQSFELPQDVPTLLREKRGVFVTLKRDGHLRGCIGHIFGEIPLVEAVAEMAKAAAFRDPRFESLEKDELDELEYEISVLTPPRKIKDVSQIEVGRHGLIIKRGRNQGLLLPQVATEFGWDREAFLAHTCQKSGLPTACWQNQDTEIYVFSAEVF